MRLTRAIDTDLKLSKSVRAIVSRVKQTRTYESCGAQVANPAQHDVSTDMVIQRGDLQAVIGDGDVASVLLGLVDVHGGGSEKRKSGRKV